jgi:hypothetical protein
MLKALLTVSALALAACYPGQGDYDPPTHGNSAYVTVPGVVECNGTIRNEYVGPQTFLPYLHCDDGRIFHNITNYSIR